MVGATLAVASSRASIALYFLQFCEVHTEALFAVFALELYLDELRTLLHFTFNDDAFAKLIVANHFTRPVLLALGAGWRRRVGRRYIAATLL